MIKVLNRSEKNMNINKTLTIALLLSVIFVCQAVGQEAKETTPGSAILSDTFGRITAEERSARFDSFFTEIQNKAGSSGYVFVYCGKVCRYGEVESHIRGIELKTRSKRFSQDRLVVMNGGFRESQEVELWLVPAGACPPSPQGKVSLKQVTFRPKTAALVTPYDCCDDYEKLWRNLKP
jgi:hypothetical protein